MLFVYYPLPWRLPIFASIALLEFVVKLMPKLFDFHPELFKI